ncbi:MarR family transcriptional regulator [Streptomyces sp. N35]|uniref:MarR family transcriptional regulator n=1 Tax=Streptomyces sp. N35 TaxID=2795730 RepID=UPI0018F44A15|nr:helix-turn-helix domain-containing protein [Streptomyces sp. N35]
MPGGRLTGQEREQIAQGLADGIAFAEIGRRLGRPTSTVTREVMRNGGAAAYRADLAHWATEQRARRRRQAVSRDGATPAPLPHGRDAGAVRAYEEVFATVFMASGLPRMTARVLVCLYTSDEGGLSAAELVRRLEVGRSSVSRAIAFLESQGLVRRERGERRRERYTVDNDVMYQSTVAGAHSTARLAETARQGVAVFGPGTPAAARLENVARFVDFISESIIRAAEQGRELLHAPPAGSPPPTPGRTPAARGT